MIATDIFVVDDERVIGQTLGIILRRAGYRVKVFHDPFVALHALRCPPRLLLTDHTMPFLSGTCLATKFIASSPSMAVLVFSGDLMDTDSEWQILSRQAANSRLLHKPLHPKQIVHAVRDAIGEAGTCPVSLPASLNTRNSSTCPLLLREVMHYSPAASMMVR